MRLRWWLRVLLMSLAWWAICVFLLAILHSLAWGQEPPKADVLRDHYREHTVDDWLKELCDQEWTCPATPGRGSCYDDARELCSKVNPQFILTTVGGSAIPQPAP